MDINPETVETTVQSVREIMLFAPETVEITIQYAVYIGFIGIGFGALIGVACRAVMSAVNIVDKIFE